MHDEQIDMPEATPPPGGVPAAGAEDLGPLFSGGVPAPIEGDGFEPGSWVPLPVEEPSDVFPDQVALDRYLRLTGARITPRVWKDPRNNGDEPAWIEPLTNGRFLVCLLGLRWHLASTQTEAKALVEKLRIQEVNTDSITRQWMEERADLFRANPAPGILTMRAILEGMGLEFREQVVLGWRMCDFLIEDRIVVEVDGVVRRARKARMDGRCRDEDLVRSGFAVYRVDEKELALALVVERHLGALMDDAALMGKEKPSLEVPSPGSVERPVIRIFTDGGCAPNPGRGGYAAILSCEGRQKEISGGFLETTNNRCEIFAAIAGLEALKKPGSVVTVVSDSRYLVDGMNKGWARKWQRNNWMRTPDEKAKNADLWARILAACAQHKVSFEWVRGHVGHIENERCDQLAGAALKRKDLPVDPGYVPGI
jgi:ribonuclease HI